MPYYLKQMSKILLHLISSCFLSQIISKGLLDELNNTIFLVGVKNCDFCFVFNFNGLAYPRYSDINFFIISNGMCAKIYFTFHKPCYN